MAMDRVWKDIFLVRAYELARNGLKDSQIAQALGTSRVSFTKWKETKPALNEALRLARANLTSNSKNGVEQFLDYVYERLSPDLKAIWELLVSEEESEIQRAEKIMEARGDRIRQKLFLHALVHYCFNPSQACRAVNISKSVLDRWIAQDAEFAALVAEMEWHKKNLFDGKLVELVMSGDPAAIIFANKTMNRDRGYNDKVEVEHKHSHSHAIVAVQVDALSIQAKKEMLAQLQAKRKQLPAHSESEEVQDAEYTTKEP